MVAPILGPFVTEIGGSGPDNQTLYSLKKTYTQTKPFTLALPYERHTGQASRSGNPPYGARRYGTQEALDYFSWSGVQNKAYERLRSKISDRAELAVTLLEYNQAAKMITKRATQLRSFVRRVRKFDFTGALEVVGLSVAPKGVSIKKSMANNMLELNFGWSPLVKDIGAAVDVLQSPLKEQFVKASARESVTKYRFNEVNYQNGYPTSGQLASRVAYEEVQVDLLVARTGAKVAVSNPNLWLANQLGFVNPVAWLWELTPWSFVVDWVFNVGQVISSFTDFYGLTVTEPWSTKHVKGVYTYHKQDVYAYSNGPPNWDLYYVAYLDQVSNRFSHTKRSLGLTAPVLTPAGVSLPSFRRMANAVSLLTQVLGKSR